MNFGINRAIIKGRERLTELPIWAGDKVFLRLLKEKEPFFSLKLVYEEERLAKAVLNGKEI